MTQLCVGPANFGSRYGFDNEKIDKKNLLKLFNSVAKNKLSFIDTSFAYAKSHLTLKSMITKNMNITAKIILKKNLNFLSVKNKIIKFNFLIFLN